MGNALRRHISRQACNVHKLKAKDTTGRWAYYFVLVQPARVAAFNRAIASEGTIDLEDFGVVIGSCYGEQATEALLTELRANYGFDL